MKRLHWGGIGRVDGWIDGGGVGWTSRPHGLQPLTPAGTWTGGTTYQCTRVRAVDAVDRYRGLGVRPRCCLGVGSCKGGCEGGGDGQARGGGPQGEGEGAAGEHAGWS